MTPQTQPKTTAPFGSWPSPIHAKLAATSHATPNWPTYVGEHEVWWTEARPDLDGRSILMRSIAHGTPLVYGPPQEVLPNDKDNEWNVRSRVIEYGGRAWLATPGQDGLSPSVVFSHYADQRLYFYFPGGPSPTALTPDPQAPELLRYLLPVLSPDGTSVWCLREYLADEKKPTEVTRSFVSVPLDGTAAGEPSKVTTLFSDQNQHFLSGPILSPGKDRVAWFSWNHPDMPWDQTELHVASVTDKPLRPVTVLQGCSVVQVEWLDNDNLLAVGDYRKDAKGDKDRWWNLYRITRDATTSRWGDPIPLYAAEEEFGGPLWGLGSRWCVPMPTKNKIVVLHGKGAQQLGTLDRKTEKPELTPLANKYTDWVGYLDVRGNCVLGVASLLDDADAVIEVCLDDHSEPRKISSGPSYADIAEYLPVPLTNPPPFSNREKKEIHATIYPPRNPHYTGPAGEHPPYVMFVHGGPTARSPLSLDLTVAYFTSRGIGVAQVDYGGSTGYGREYRNRLRGQWGLLDVHDTEDIARALAKEGLADGQRLGIRGGSAGGFTSAAAITSEKKPEDKTFAAATVMYPVLDLVEFAKGGTHDFESKYLEGLVGKFDEKKYQERSPINNTRNISVSFVILQGLEDPICPPGQCYAFLTQMMKEWTTDPTRGEPPSHSYVGFHGETHGFRKQENIIIALEAELSLYGAAFGFTPFKDAHLDKASQNTPTVAGVLP